MCSEFANGDIFEGLFFQDKFHSAGFFTPSPLLSEEGTALKVLRACTWMPRPELGLDCLVCSEFASTNNFEGLFLHPPPAAQPRGDNLKGFTGFDLDAEARTWP